MKPLLRIVGKTGSKACKEIIANADIPRYKGNKYGKVTAIVNYGLAGTRLKSFMRTFPSAVKLPMLNKYIGCPKYQAIKEAKKAGILTPETRLSLKRVHDSSEWLIKRQHSIGGIGIKKAEGKAPRKGEYYQKFVSNRKYELRVHAFKWEDCTVQKRLGDVDVIAWNYKNGGHFQNVSSPNRYAIFREAIDISLKVLEIRAMAFGAVDFIVDTDGKIYFIEVNSSPGFTEFSKHIYVDAFKALTRLNKTQVLSLCK